MGYLNYNAVIRVIITIPKMPLITLTTTTVIIMTDIFTALAVCPKCFTYINLPSLPNNCMSTWMVCDKW